jgi:HAD superfamily 5'-nucleotidase-like hydrolase
MPVFVNRMLNLKKIKLIGFDMDYTLIRYDTKEFETLAHSYAAAWLVRERGYPAAVAGLIFDPQRAILGLVIDRRNGNLLKLSRYSKVKQAFHGLAEIDYRTVKETYQNIAIDLRSPEYVPLDTSFAISTGVLFSQLVELKSQGLVLPDFATLANDAGSAVDMVHRDGSIKKVILADPGRFIIKDPSVARLLERYKDYGKQLMIITNSDYAYTRALMEYAFDPFWQRHKCWREVFDIVITLADKPRFFERPGRFLAIDPETGLMRNHEGSVSSGLFQGGWFQKLQQDLGLPGNEILYIGDHIYGDVVSIKKRCDWRTALVLGDLEAEIAGTKAGKPLQERVEELMDEKSGLEREINRLDLARYEGQAVDRAALDGLFERVDAINGEIAELLARYRTNFNPWWGEVLRAGQEESRYADQIDKYACIYMTRVADLYEYSPKTYFRPWRRVMPHEA